MLKLRIYGFILLVSCNFAFAQRTDPSEVSALVEVKNSLIDPFNHIRDWDKGDPCISNWTGVLCYDKAGIDGYFHVRVLQLLNMNLSGNLAPQLGQLSQLWTLDFMWNKLDGIIPKEIGKISSLRLLLLNGNRLSGSLPDELGLLSNLLRFQVDENHISGPIPNSYANLTSVRHIHFNNNSLSGQIPAGFSELPSLLHLLLDNNNLSGSLPPEFSNLPALRILQLDNNNFNGSEIPPTYSNLTKLAKLSLRNCSLHGTIPDLSNISNLYYIDLSRNQLTGPAPSKISDNMTTINLSNNQLNDSIPESFSNLPFLQRLSIENNLFTGSVPISIWQNLSSTSDKLTIDLRNNLLSNISGELKPPVNVTLSLGGNPICQRANIPNISQFCGAVAGADGSTESLNNSTTSCPMQACPIDGFFEYVPVAPVWCFCASPLRIGYRLKSPSFSYFPPYTYPLEEYLANALELDLYQVVIDSFYWEKGPRLRMYLKLFPAWNNDSHSNTFNSTEVQRIRAMFMSWTFPRTDFFGPYELLNFTLQGPYSELRFGTHKARINKAVWAAIILGAIAFIVTASVIVTILFMRKHARFERNLSRKRLSSKISMKIDGMKSFSFKEMTQASDNFNISTQVGRGGYGRVYRGVLADGTVVAIKRAEEGSLQGQKEFLTEIKLLSRLHHRNLVSLIGYCDEEGEQMLVYEYIPNGTLRDWLSGKATEKLTFAMRLKIALGSAKGIMYLHTEANPPVFHRDIKATNILLDSKLTAKVADFGLSRLAPVLDDEGNLPNYVSTVVKGTPGYLDPEYFLTHKLTDKSDVYSLGIVFLELLTGMQPISHGKNIAREVNMARQSGIMFSIIDSRMGAYPSEFVERFTALAIRCCHEKPETRPSMSEVVRELETIIKTTQSETDAISSESTSPYSGSVTSTYFGNSATSSSYYTSNHPYASSQVSGSDLVSGVVPTINPR